MQGICSSWELQRSDTEKTELEVYRQTYEIIKEQLQMLQRSRGLGPQLDYFHLQRVPLTAGHHCHADLPKVG